MVFLLKKAAIAALIATGLTIGAFNYFAQESAKNRTRTQFQGGGGSGGVMFDTSYANRSRPRLLFSDTLFQSPFRSNVPCNCQVITNCPNIKPGGNIRGRHCGFQGFQRKICCDDEDASAPKITDEQIEDAYKQKALTEIYRNPDIFRNESQILDPGSGQSDEYNNDQANIGKSPGSLSPLDILSMEAEDFGRPNNKEIPTGGEKPTDSAEQYSEGGPPSYSDSRRIGTDSIESLFPMYYDSEGSDKKPQITKDKDKQDRTGKIDAPNLSSLRDFFPEYYDEYLNLFRNSTDSNSNNDPSSSSSSSSSSSNNNDSVSTNSDDSVTDKSEPSVSEVSGSTTIINSIDTSSSSLSPDDIQSDVVTSISVSMEKSSYVTSKSFTMNMNNSQEEPVESKQGDLLDETVIKNGSSSSSIPSEAIPTSVSMVMSISGGQSTRNTTSKSITMTLMSSPTKATEASIAEDMLTTATTEISTQINNSSTTENEDIASTVTSTPVTSTSTESSPEYSEGMVNTGAPGEVNDLRLSSTSDSSTSSLSSLGMADETTTESQMPPDVNIKMIIGSNTNSNDSDEGSVSTMSSTTSLSSQTEKFSDSLLEDNFSTTPISSTFNDTQTITLIPDTSLADDEDKTTSFSTMNASSSSVPTTSSPSFVPTSVVSNNDEPTTTNSALSLAQTTTPVSFTPEKTSLFSDSESKSEASVSTTLAPSLNTTVEKEPGISFILDEPTTNSPEVTTLEENNKNVINNMKMMDNPLENSSVSDDAPRETTTPFRSDIDEATLSDTSSRDDTEDTSSRLLGGFTTTTVTYVGDLSSTKGAVMDGTPSSLASSSSISGSLADDTTTSEIASPDEFTTTTSYSSTTGSQQALEISTGTSYPSTTSNGTKESHETTTKAYPDGTNNYGDLETTMNVLSSSPYGDDIDASKSFSSTTESSKTEKTSDISKDIFDDGTPPAPTTESSALLAAESTTYKTSTVESINRIESGTPISKNTDELVMTTNGKSDTVESGTITTLDSVGSSTEQSSSTLKSQSDDISITTPPSSISIDESTTPLDKLTSINMDEPHTTMNYEAKPLNSENTVTPESINNFNDQNATENPIISSTESSYGVDFTSTEDSSMIRNSVENLKNDNQDFHSSTRKQTNGSDLATSEKSETDTTTLKPESTPVTYEDLDMGVITTTGPSRKDIQPTTQESTLRDFMISTSPDSTLLDKATTIMTLEDDTTLSGVVGTSGSSTPAGLLPEMELTTKSFGQQEESITTNADLTTISPSILDPSTESTKTLGELVTSTLVSIKEFFTSTASSVSDDDVGSTNAPTTESLTSTSTSKITGVSSTESGSSVYEIQSTSNPNVPTESPERINSLDAINASLYDNPTTVVPLTSGETEVPMDLGHPETTKIASNIHFSTTRTPFEESFTDLPTTESANDKTKSNHESSTTERSRFETDLPTSPVSDTDETTPSAITLGVNENKTEEGSTVNALDDNLVTTTNQPVQLVSTLDSVTSISGVTDEHSSSPQSFNSQTPIASTIYPKTEEVITTTLKDESVSSIQDSTTVEPKPIQTPVDSTSPTLPEQESSTLPFKTSEVGIMVSDISTLPTPSASPEDDLSDIPTTITSVTDKNTISSSSSTTASFTDSVSSALPEMTETPISFYLKDSLSSTVSNYPESATSQPNTESEVMGTSTEEMGAAGLIDTVTNAKVSDDTQERFTTINPHDHDESTPKFTGELSNSMREIVMTTSIPTGDGNPEGDINNNESQVSSTTTAGSEGSLLAEDTTKVTSNAESRDEGITEKSETTKNYNNEGVTTEVLKNDMSTTATIVTAVKGEQDVTTESPQINDSNDEANMKEIKDSTTMHSLLEDVMATVQSFVDSIMSTTTEKSNDKLEDIPMTTTLRSDRRSGDDADSSSESPAASTERPVDVEVTTSGEGLELTTTSQSRRSTSTSSPEITTSESILKNSVPTTNTPESTTLQTEKDSKSGLARDNDEIPTTIKSPVVNTEIPSEMLDESKTSTPSLSASKSSTDEATTMSHLTMREDPTSSTDKSHPSSTHSSDGVIIVGTDEPATTPESMSLLNAYQTTIDPSSELEIGKVTEVPTTPRTSIISEDSPKTTTMKMNEASNGFDTESTTMQIPVDNQSSTEETSVTNTPKTPENTSRIDGTSTQYETTTPVQKTEEVTQSSADRSSEVVTFGMGKVTEIPLSVISAEKNTNFISIEQSTIKNLENDDFTELPTTKLPESSGLLIQDNDMHRTTVASLQLPEDLSHTTVPPQDPTSVSSVGASSRSVSDSATESQTVSSAGGFDTSTTVASSNNVAEKVDKSQSTLPSSQDEITTISTQSFETASNEIPARTPDTTKNFMADVTDVPETSSTQALTDTTMSSVSRLNQLDIISKPLDSTTEQSTSKSFTDEEIIQTTTTELSGNKKLESETIKESASKKGDEEANNPVGDFPTTAPSDLVNNEEQETYSTTSSYSDLPDTDKTSTSFGISSTMSDLTTESDEISTLMPVGDRMTTEMPSLESGESKTSSSRPPSKPASLDSILDATTSEKTIYKDKSEKTEDDIFTSTESSKDAPSTTLRSESMYGLMDADEMGTTLSPLIASTIPTSKIIEESETTSKDNTMSHTSTISASYPLTTEAVPTTSTETSKMTNEKTTLLPDMQSEMNSTASSTTNINSSPKPLIQISYDNEETTTPSQQIMDEVTSTPTSLNGDSTTMISAESPSAASTPPISSTTELSGSSLSQDNSIQKDETSTSLPISSDSEDFSTMSSNKLNISEMNMNLNMDLKLSSSTSPSSMLNDDTMTDIESSTMMMTDKTVETTTTTAFSSNDQSTTKAPSIISSSTSEPLLDSTMRNVANEEISEYSTIANLVKDETTTIIPSNPTLSPFIISDNTSSVEIKGLSLIKSDTTTTTTSRTDATSSLPSETEEISSTSSSARDLLLESSTPGAPDTNPTTTEIDPNRILDETDLLEKDRENSATKANHSNGMSQSVDITQITIDDSEVVTTSKPGESYSPTEKVFHGEVGTTTTLNPQSATERPILGENDIPIPTTDRSESIVETTTGYSYGEDEAIRETTTTETKAEKVNEPFFVLNITEILPPKIIELANMTRVIYEDSLSEEQQKESKEENAYMDVTTKQSKFPVGINDDIEMTTAAATGTLPTTAKNILSFSTLPSSISSESSTEEQSTNGNSGLISIEKSNPTEEQSESTTTAIDISFDEMETLKPEGIQETGIHSVSDSTTDSAAVSMPTTTTTTLSMTQENLDEIDEAYSTSTSTTTSSHNAEQLYSTESSPIRGNGTSQDLLLIPDEGISTTLSNAEGNVPTTTTASASLLTMTNNSLVTPGSAVNEMMVDSEILITTTSSPVTAQSNEDFTTTTESVTQASRSPTFSLTEEKGMDDGNTIFDDATETTETTTTTTRTMFTHLETNATSEDTTTISFPRNQTPSKIVSKFETTTVTGGVSLQDSTISDTQREEFPTTTQTSLYLGDIITEDDVSVKVPVMNNQNLEPQQIYTTSETSVQEDTTTTNTDSVTLKPTTPPSSFPDDDSKSKTTQATNDDLNASTSTEGINEQIENTSVYFLADEIENTKDSTTLTSVQEDFSASPARAENSTPGSLIFNEEPVTSISSMITNQTSRVTVLRPTTLSPIALNDPRTSTDITHSVRKIPPESDRTVVELVRELSKVKTKITHSINSVKNSNVELHEVNGEATTTEASFETSTMPSITSTPDVSEYPTNPYGYSQDEDATSTTPTSFTTTADAETSYPTTTYPSRTNENTTSIEIEPPATTVLTDNGSLTFDESFDEREAEHLTESKHQIGDDVHEEGQITPTGIISTTTEITKSSEESTKVPSVSLEEEKDSIGKQPGRNESEWKDSTTTAYTVGADTTEDSLVVSTTAFTQEWGMEEEQETFETTTSEGPTIITLEQTNRSTETFPSVPTEATTTIPSTSSTPNSSLLSSSSRNQRLFDGGSSSLFDVENTFEKSLPPITKQQPTINTHASTVQTVLFEMDERTTTAGTGTTDEEEDGVQGTDIPRSTTQITQPGTEMYPVGDMDDMTPNSFIDFYNETTRFLGNETTERSNLQDEGTEISNVGNSTEKHFTFNNGTESEPEINLDYLKTTTIIPMLNTSSNTSDLVTTEWHTTTTPEDESTISTIKTIQSFSSSPPTPFETIVTLDTPSPSQMPPVPYQEDISLMEGQLTTTASYSNEMSTVINNDTVTTTTVSHSTELDDHEHISAAESKARSESLFNLYNEIFQPVGPAPVENSTEKYPHNHHHHHHPNYNTQRKDNSRKLILEVVTPPPTTTAPTPQVIDVDEDADEFFKTPIAISHPGETQDNDELTSTTSTTQESTKLKVRVKVGPGGESSSSPGRLPLIKAGRELFPSEAKEIEQQLNNQISNVVNQLLLTTHENFRLLPSFLECAAASSRKARRKTRVLNFDTENHPWMARIGYQERGGLTFSCSGTIISQKYILTSATCAHKHEGRITDVLLESIKHTELQEHSPDINSNSSSDARTTLSSPYKLKVQGVYSHPQYDPKSRLNDLALIRLREEIGFNSTSEVRPICLPFEDGYGVWDSLPRPGDIAYLGGWGFEQKNSTKKIADLSESSVKIWSNQNCSRAYAGDAEKRVTSQQLCAYSSREKVCRGDAGAPLMAVMTRHRIFFQIGVVSYGPQCGFQVPRVYTRVSEYLKWILDSMDP